METGEVEVDLAVTGEAEVEVDMVVTGAGIEEDLARGAAEAEADSASDVVEAEEDLVRGVVEVEATGEDSASDEVVVDLVQEEVVPEAAVTGRRDPTLSIRYVRSLAYPPMFPKLTHSTGSRTTLSDTVALYTIPHFLFFSSHL